MVDQKGGERGPGGAGVNLDRPLHGRFFSCSTGTPSSWSSRSSSSMATASWCTGWPGKARRLKMHFLIFLLFRNERKSRLKVAHAVGKHFSLFNWIPMMLIICLGRSQVPCNLYFTSSNTRQLKEHTNIPRLPCSKSFYLLLKLTFESLLQGHFACHCYYQGDF